MDKTHDHKESGQVIRLAFRKNAHVVITSEQLQQLPEDVRDRIWRVIKESARLVKENYQLHRRLLHDELTGAHSPLAFSERGEESLAKIQRNKFGTAIGRAGDAPVITVVAIDLDGFKGVNDAFGHAEGDRALKYFVKFLKRNLRLSDYVARKGGDEFSILFDGDEANTRHRLELLREQFIMDGYITGKHRKSQLANQRIYLSFSYGAYQLNDNDKNFEDAYKKADDACYADKKATKLPRKLAWDAQHGKASS